MTTQDDEDEEEAAVRQVAIEAIGGALACHLMVAPGGLWIEPESSPVAASLALGEFVDDQGANFVQAAQIRACNYLAVAREHLWSAYRLLDIGVVNLGLLSLGRVTLETATRGWHLVCEPDSDRVRVSRYLNEHISDGAQEMSIWRSETEASEPETAEPIPGRREVARQVCAFALDQFGLPTVGDRQGRPAWVLESRPDIHTLVGDFQARMGFPAGEWAYRLLCSVVHGSMSTFDAFSNRESSVDEHSHVHGADTVRIIDVAVRCPTHAYFEAVLRMSDRYETGRTKDFGSIVSRTDTALHHLHRLIHELRPERTT